MAPVYRAGYLAKMREEVEQLEKTLSPQSVAMAKELSDRLAANSRASRIFTPEGTEH